MPVRAVTATITDIPVGVETTSDRAVIDPSSVKYDERGLVPCIVQEWSTGEVLMLAYMNQESVAKTLQTGRTWFYSRSRAKLWNKGETSGHFQQVREMRYDCDADTLLALVEQIGPACHTGTKSCFDERLLGMPADTAPLFLVPGELARMVAAGRDTSGEVFSTGELVVERARQTVRAAADADADGVILGASELLYQLLLLLAEVDVGLPEVWRELQRRKG